MLYIRWLKRQALVTPSASSLLSTTRMLLLSRLCSTHTTRSSRQVSTSPSGRIGLERGCSVYAVHRRRKCSCLYRARKKFAALMHAFVVTSHRHCSRAAWRTCCSTVGEVSQHSSPTSSGGRTMSGTHNELHRISRAAQSYKGLRSADWQTVQQLC